MQIELVDRFLWTLLLIAISAFFRSVYEHLFDKYTRGRLHQWVSDKPFWKQWVDPEVSWRNKYLLDETWIGPIAGPLLSGPLVFLTDARHFSQFCMSLFAELAILVALGLSPSSWTFWYWLFVLNFIEGFVFEVFYGRILMKREIDAVRQHRGINQVPRNLFRYRSFREWCMDNYRTIFVSFLPITFVLSYLVYRLLGGCTTTACFNAEESFSPAAWGAVATIAAGLTFTWYTQYLIRTPAKE